MVSSPTVLSCQSSALSNVPVIRAPLIPNGCPTAIAPPMTLSFSSGIPRSRYDGMTCAANASLISTRSMSSIVIPARRSACRDASTGPSPMISGERAVTPVDTIRASGVIPSSAAFVEDITMTAAAPSLSGQQLPAVIRPSGRNTGLSAATPSSVTPLRGPSSADTTVPVGVLTGVISRCQNPSAIAFSARFWLRTPNSSMSSRVTPLS
jgi:hypothetical protein